MPIRFGVSEQTAKREALAKLRIFANKANQGGLSETPRLTRRCSGAAPAPLWREVSGENAAGGSGRRLGWGRPLHLLPLGGLSETPLEVIMTGYFSESEAKGLIGRKVETRSPLQSVPAGTVGTVIGASSRAEGWVLQVRWKVRRSSFLNLMVGDACLNIPRRERSITEELTRWDLEANTQLVS